MLRSTALLALGSFAFAGCTTTSNKGDQQTAGNTDERRGIDADVDAAMQRLYAAVPGSRELVAKARGVLVFPSVLQAGLVVGGEYGKGALRVGGTTAGYFSTTSASFGFQAGAQSKALYFLFMTPEALDKLRNSDGWSAGADASVALVHVGANGVVDTTTATAPVEAFVLTNTGLMGDVSLSGTKVSRLKI
jgi:lipid-binding SYLF domain-containing protein